MSNLFFLVVLCNCQAVLLFDFLHLHWGNLTRRSLYRYHSIAESDGPSEPPTRALLNAGARGGQTDRSTVPQLA